MFKHDMQEAKTGKVSIKDFDLETFRELLHFIYLGRTSEPLDASKAQPLFLAADKYDILDLREDCSRKLLSSMQLCNAIELMIWAHNNSVDHVKEAALEVVVRNGKEICLQQDWEMLTIIHPELCPLATRRMMEIAQFPAVKRKASN
jgi:speckle-type POZ protein